MRNLLIILACLYPTTALAQEILVRPVIKPAPVTLVELETVPGSKPQKECSFSPAVLTSAQGEITLPDSANLQVPAGWQRLPPQALDAELGAIRLSTPDGSRIRVARERNGARGRTFIMYRSGETPDGDSCRIAQDEVGAIWTFYEPDPGAPDNPLPFSAFGDFITPSRRWYRVSSFSKTAEQRELVAQALTTVFLRQIE